MPRPRTSATLFQDEAPSTKPWITAHCDGGSRGNPGPAGYGAVLVDPAGLLLAELSEFIGIKSNNVAEYSGLLAVLQWALDHHHPNLRVVSDSLLMVNQINGRYKVASPDLRPLWEEARRRIKLLDAFEITHALRHKNKEADRLANAAMDRGMGRTTTPDPVNLRATKPSTPAKIPASPKMLRGFTRNGAIHLLGDVTLPDGIFVKIIPE
jgi:ribonuclease HI